MVSDDEDNVAGAKGGGYRGNEGGHLGRFDDDHDDGIGNNDDDDDLGEEKGVRFGRKGTIKVKIRSMAFL